MKTYSQYTDRHQLMLVLVRHSKNYLPIGMMLQAMRVNIPHHDLLLYLILTFHLANILHDSLPLTAAPTVS